MRPLGRVLVANRGEIAVRVLRGCREAGLPTAAVFSSADRGALHVRHADRALEIGPPPPRESYLDIERILNAARRLEAGSVHPGYGFLAENEDFAQACEDAGMNSVLEKLLSQPEERRHLLVRELLAEFHVKQAPPELIAAFMPLLDDDVADTAWRVIYQCGADH